MVSVGVLLHSLAHLPDSSPFLFIFPVSGTKLAPRLWLNYKQRVSAKRLDPQFPAGLTLRFHESSIKSFQNKQNCSL